MGCLDLRCGKPGLGPNSWGSIRHLLPYHVRFHEPACVHDTQGYAKGGTPEDKFDADIRFLRECLAKCRDSTPGIMFAFLYYALLRLGGLAYFPYHGNND